MTITEIYKKYEIPPNLADHQLTVASVANVICEHTNKGNLHRIVLACLLHDMGNIIKFNLDKSIPGADIDDIEYWKEVQQRFVEKYGNDEHAATLAIVRDIGVDDGVIELIDAVGFRHSIDTLNSGDVSKMIAGYSDMRVAPHGVVSLEERLSDLTKRYGSTDDREQYNQAFRQIETLIFADTKVGPEAVDQLLVDEKKKKLSNIVV